MPGRTGPPDHGDDDDDGDDDGLSSHCRIVEAFRTFPPDDDKYDDDGDDDDDNSDANADDDARASLRKASEVQSLKGNSESCLIPGGGAV